jgi:dihydrodipicolinate synthase/N-acetylneuraminate lyase
MNAWDTAVGVVLGAAVIVISDVVKLIDACERTKGREASARKIKTRILDHMEPRNSSGLTEKWM